MLYGDTDQMGVVYYANYLRFFEGARNEWIRGLGIPYTQIEERGIMLPVLEASAQYLKPARYDDVLVVRASVSEMKRASLKFSYELRKEGAAEILCTGYTVHACVNKEGRVTRAPDWLLAAMEGHSRRMTREGSNG